MAKTDHWFEPLADHLGSAYLRYSFTKGTKSEVDQIVRRLDLRPGSRVLDVGCGPGRHANELGRRGIDVVGVDISQTFLELAQADAPALVSYVRRDARALEFDAEFDAVISVCQGAFGLAGGPADQGGTVDPDAEILAQMAAAVRPGGLVLFTAFNAYLQVRHLVEGNHFDADRGVHHERTAVRSPIGESIETDLWTSCFTPRELRLLLELTGLDLVSMTAAEPGSWGDDRPGIEEPEYLVVARRKT